MVFIKVYNPGTNLGKNICEKIGKLKVDFKGANQRMHNKTFTVDGKVAITGGRNIAMNILIPITIIISGIETF